VYKTWFPLAGRWLEFDEVEVTVTGAGTLTARVLAPGPVTSLQGWWAARDGLLGTAVALTAEG